LQTMPPCRVGLLSRKRFRSLWETAEDCRLRDGLPCILADPDRFLFSEAAKISVRNAIAIRGLSPVANPILTSLNFSLPTSFLETWPGRDQVQEHFASWGSPRLIVKGTLMGCLSMPLSAENSLRESSSPEGPYPQLHSDERRKLLYVRSVRSYSKLRWPGCLLPSVQHHGDHERSVRHYYQFGFFSSANSGGLDLFSISGPDSTLRLRCVISKARLAPVSESPATLSLSTTAFPVGDLARRRVASRL
jgi:hypothetical protein